MKKLLLLASISASAILFSQSKSEPLVLVDGKIASKNLVSKTSRFVKKVETYTKALPASLAAFSSYMPATVISATYSQPAYDRIPLSTLNISQDIPENTPVKVDGRLFTDTSIEILGEAILRGEVINENGQRMFSIITRK